MNFSSSRFFFSSMASAVEALAVVLEDARYTRHSYSFGSLSAQQVLASGLMLVGEIDDISEKLESIDGATRHED